MATTGGGKQEDVSYASFMSSKAFEFLVGPEKKPFTIHSELVASLSPVLERLIKGIKLLRYCFENDTPAELREFVMRYAVCHIEELWKRTEITELARTHADFSSAIVEAMLHSLDW